MTPSEQMREAAAKAIRAEAKVTPYFKSRTVAFQRGMSDGFEAAAQVVEELILPPEPPLAAMEAALREIANMRDYQSPTAQSRAIAALAELDATDAKAMANPKVRALVDAAGKAEVILTVIACMIETDTPIDAAAEIRGVQSAIAAALAAIKETDHE